MGTTALLSFKNNIRRQGGALRLPISGAFMLFLLASISVLGLSLGTVMVVKVDALITDNRQELIHQKMQGIAKELLNYFRLRDIVLKDYAAFPVLLQGVMQPNANLANAQDFIDELLILGDKTPLHLMDLNGEVIYSTQPESPCVSGNITPLSSLEGIAEPNLHFCTHENLVKKSWVLVTPILYHGHIEGYLSAELPSARLLSSLSLGENTKQNQIELVDDATKKILLTLGPTLNQQAMEINIPELDLVLRYRTDKRALLAARKAVITNLVISLTIILAIILTLSKKLGYTYLVQPLEHFRGLTQKLAEGKSVAHNETNQVIQEIYDLENHFKKMEAKIRRRERALTSANDSLKSLNQQILQQQQLLVHSEKLASVGQLAAGVAHEINNPTGFVKGNLEILQKYASSITAVFQAYTSLENTCTDDDARKQSLQKLQNVKATHDIAYILEDICELAEESLEGTVRIQNIVKDLKSFSRVDDQAMKTVDINQEVIEIALRLVSNEIKYKCTVDKELAAVPALTCMPGEISQVIMNLLTNACDAIEDNGKITIASYQENSDICIDVSDTGSGIVDKDKLKIFDPFYTTKDVGKGTGLGLAICQAIIRKHGGDITFETAVGQGTTFKVRLPVKGQTNAIKNKASQTAECNTGEKNASLDTLC